MDEKPIRQALEALAEQEINSDMNLWPTIQKQVEKSKPIPRQHWLSLGRAILIASIFLMSAVAYALYQTSNGDPGLESVQNEQLVTPLKMSQTVDGITVNLDWGYADSNRIVLAYTIDEPEGVNTAPLYSLPFALSDASGNYFPTDSIVGIGGLKVEPEVNTLTNGFDPSCLGADQPDSLDLVFNLALSVEHVTTSYSGGGGGGGGGGASTGCVQMSDLASAAPPEGQEIVQFKFEFTLPMLHAVNISEQPKVTANSVEMQVTSLSVSPSMTRVMLCYSLPDQNPDWSLKGFELIGEDKVAFQGNSIGPSDAGNCATAMIPAAYRPGKTTEMTLTVTDLMTNYDYSPENTQTFADLMAEKGFKIEITGTGEGFNFNTVSQPENLSSQELNDLTYAAMEQAFRRYHPGSWSFTFTLP